MYLVTAPVKVVFYTFLLTHFYVLNLQEPLDFKQHILNAKQINNSFKATVKLCDFLIGD